jgi:hypothetical protein
MRYDMAKVLIERPRTHSSEKSRKWGKRIPYDPESDYDNEQTRTGRRRRQFINTKGLGNKESTDVLGPLKGYLQKNVGRCWNDVYSEICQYMDRRSTVGAHIFTHLWQYVAKNCWVGSKGKIKTYHRYSDYFVCPVTGILCESADHFAFAPHEKKPVTFVKLENRKGYEWIKGVWYYTEFFFVTVFETYEGWDHRKHARAKEEKVYQVKRQLGKKELKKLGLSNLKLRSA